MTTVPNIISQLKELDSAKKPSIEKQNMDKINKKSKKIKKEGSKSKKQDYLNKGRTIMCMDGPELAKYTIRQQE